MPKTTDNIQEEIRISKLEDYIHDATYTAREEGMSEFDILECVKNAFENFNNDKKV